MNKAVKLKGTTLHTPSTYSTVDDAVYVRVVSFSTGGTNFKVADDSGGSTVVARYAVAPGEALYIRKDAGQYIGGGSANLRCSAVALEG